MTWAEILHRPGTFVRLEGGSLDIGIVGFTPDDEPPPELFAEVFEESLALTGSTVYGAAMTPDEDHTATATRRPWQTNATHASGERYWIRPWGRLVCRVTRRHKDRPTIKGIRIDTGERIHGHQCLRCWRGVENGSPDGAS